jgi:hypothetical protein
MTRTGLSVRISLAALAAAALSVGCDQPKEGALNNVSFTPTNCGLLVGCDFDDSIGVGGKIDVQISGIDGFSTAGIDLASRNPDVFDVVAVGDVGGEPTWEITANSAGIADLAALLDGEEQDFLEIAIQDVDHYISENILGTAVGPSADPNADEGWAINADERVTFQVTPTIGDSVPTMGRFTFLATLDPEIEEGAMVDQEPGEGHLDFLVPPGDYIVDFESDADGLTLSVAFHATAPL